MDLSTLSQNQLFIAIISLIGGIIITTIFNKVSNRMKKILYSVFVNKIGLSADDPIFGNVRVTWQDNQMRNLYFVVVNIENNSNRDLENVIIKSYTNQGTILLRVRPLT